MAKNNLLDLRFAVINTLGRASNLWRLWVSKAGDVYLSYRSMAKIEKYSFHTSGICRNAFTKEFGSPIGQGDRLNFKWNRSVSPSIGLNGMSRVALISFPTDCLSRLKYNKAFTGIPAAPIGNSTFVELGFTFESEEIVSKLLGKEKFLISFVSLPSNENFFISYYHDKWENKELNMPAKNEFPGYLFPHKDENDTGLPIRISLNTIPKENEWVCIMELGGFKV